MQMKWERKPSPPPGPSGTSLGEVRHKPDTLGIAHSYPHTPTHTHTHRHPQVYTHPQSHLLCCPRAYPLNQQAFLEHLLSASCSAAWQYDNSLSQPLRKLQSRRRQTSNQLLNSNIRAMTEVSVGCCGEPEVQEEAWRFM